MESIKKRNWCSLREFFLLILLTISFISCKKNIGKKAEIKLDTKEEKKVFANVEEKILQYNSNIKEYWENGHKETALSYKDSIRELIVNSFISEYKFKTFDDSIYDTSKRDKPLFIQVTATWCAPCKFELPALNKVAEKYGDRVDFLLLFWDTREQLKKIASEYHEKLVLIPSPNEQTENGVVDIYGFRNVIGFPTNYLVTEKDKIINFSQGAMLPSTSTDENGKEVIITKEQANQSNYERLEDEIKDLLEKNNTTAQNQDNALQDIGLRQLLDSIYDEDQNDRIKYMQLVAEKGKNATEAQILWSSILKKDTLNVKLVTDIIDKYGWLGADAVGEKGNTAIFLVIQHSNLDKQEKYLPIMKDAVAKGNALAKHLALLEDRVAIRNGKKQIYGSQVEVNPETGKHYPLPMIDPKNVNERRAKIGLGTIEDYLNSFDN